MLRMRPSAEHGEIGALDRAVGAIGAEPPRKADVVAKTVGFADQLEFEIRKALLHARYQRVDAVMAITGHQRIDVSWRPLVQFAASISRRRPGVRSFHRSM